MTILPFTSEELYQMYKQDENLQVLRLLSTLLHIFEWLSIEIIDVIPMCIANQFLSMLSKALRHNLEADLGLLNDDAAKIWAMYAVEEPDTDERGKTLTRMKVIILESLKSWGSSWYEEALGNLKFYSFLSNR